MTQPIQKKRTETLTATTSISQYNRLVLTSFFVDVPVVAGALLIAYWIRFETAISEIGVVDREGLILRSYSGHIMCSLVLMMLILTNFRFYSREVLLSFVRTVQVILKSSLLWIVGYLTLSLVLKFDPPISRIYCAVGLGTVLVLLPLWRGLLWSHLSSNNHSACLRERAIVVGWSKSFDDAFLTLRDSPEREFDIVGIVAPPEDEFEEKPPADIPVLGNFKRLEILLQMGVCQMVIVADDTLRKGNILELASLCEKEMIDFELVPIGFRVLLNGLNLENVGGIPVLGITSLPLHSALNQYLKHLIDIIGAIAGLLLASPLIALFGFLIYRESPGPIFYRQRRLGANGKILEMVKLRSVKLDAEVAGQVEWTVKDDPRCLKIGALMRRLNIDEIPQFWNVLTGDMSLVGPRPERPELIEKFKEEIPH